MLFLLSSIVNLGQFVIWSRFITKLYHGNQPYSFALYIITSKITLQTYAYEINNEQNLQAMFYKHYSTIHSWLYETNDNPISFKFDNQ